MLISIRTAPTFSGNTTDFDNAANAAVDPIFGDGFSVTGGSMNGDSITATTDTTPDWDNQDVDTAVFTFNDSSDDIDLLSQGNYKLEWCINVDGLNDQDFIQVKVLVNGAVERGPAINTSGTSGANIEAVTLKHLSAGDTIRLDVRTGSAGTITGYSNKTYITISKPD